MPASRTPFTRIWLPSSHGPASQKPYLIFINPRSGPGAAESQFRNTVAPLFSRLGIPYVVIKTRKC
ncbi:uncharacterized protein DEA37_0006422 [Paragonimus westermani]|uniref:DAGKc domain-containing protein n=1 Tax=Paragonimus westermani TaxID=34504 RepID=A0A5J4NIN9_9TREM|nr:uncharacterized protein DEA37_0006422 [Paragonimus westermani]